MKTTLLSIVLIAITTLSSCIKEDKGCNQQLGNPQAPANEIANVQTYLSGAGITNATQHSSGLFYTITNGGTGTVNAAQCDVVTVRYTGKLTSGTTFDSNTTGIQFNLYGLITGWRIGIPLIKAGGSIRLYVPPSLGYGATAVQGIPANSILIFDIDLLAVN